MLASRDGDHDAFGELYKRFFPMVHGILLLQLQSFCGSAVLHLNQIEPAAEDHMQPFHAPCWTGLQMAILMAILSG